MSLTRTLSLGISAAALAVTAVTPQLSATATERWAHTAPAAATHADKQGRRVCEPQVYADRVSFGNTFLNYRAMVGGLPLTPILSDAMLDPVVHVQKCWHRHRPHLQAWRVTKVFIPMRITDDSGPGQKFMCPDIIPGFRQLKWSGIADGAGMTAGLVPFGPTDGTQGVQCERDRSIWKTYKYRGRDRLPYVHISKHGEKPKIVLGQHFDIRLDDDPDPVIVHWQLH